MSGIWTLLLPLLQAIFAAVTPTLKKELDKFALNLYVRARGTPNQADDIATAFLLAMLGLETPILSEPAKAEDPTANP